MSAYDPGGAPEAASEPAPKPRNVKLTLALDYGPLILFFIVYKFTDVFTGTAVFIAAALLAAALAYKLNGKISPMLALSTVLIAGFGGLTLLLGDQKFIQIKPTVIYLLLSGVLFGGLLLGKPLLRTVLEVGFDGLSDRGWWLLTRNWACFFLGLAGLNEVLRHQLSFDGWMTAKLVAFPVLSFLFIVANAPMMIRHGLGGDAKGNDASGTAD